jgi:hypothetical protein
MNKPTASPVILLVVLLAILTVTGCKSQPNPIVGTWIVEDPKAPFPEHMYVFNADGTMQQANPDAGDPNSSDSDGKGIWTADGDQIKGKWVEITADRTTHKYTGRGELSFGLRVSGDDFTGQETFRSYNPQNQPTGSEPASPLIGKRLTLP